MNKLDWDYTKLVENYHKRAPYSQKLINDVIDMTGLNESSRICDIGAGTGFLSREFAKHKIEVVAVEPNDEMRKAGEAECQHKSKVKWFKGHAENTQQTSNHFDLVGFGSSFNVVNRELALKESKRLCKPNGWFLAVWNHRDLESGLQFEIEQYINLKIPTYDYGIRRQDQQQYLEGSNLFSSLQSIQDPFTYEQSAEDVISAWASHATLQRQAGSQHQSILDGITALIKQHSGPVVNTKFYTQAWLGQFKS